MGYKHFSPEQIVHQRRQADVEWGKGQTMAAVGKLLGIVEATYFRWRKEYGGLKVAQAKRAKELE